MHARSKGTLARLETTLGILHLPSAPPLRALLFQPSHNPSWCFATSFPLRTLPLATQKRTDQVYFEPSLSPLQIYNGKAVTLALLPRCPVANLTRLPTSPSLATWNPANSLLSDPQNRRPGPCHLLRAFFAPSQSMPSLLVTSLDA